MTYYLLMHACRSLPLNVPRARLKAAHVYEENSEYDMDHLAISASCNDRRWRARCKVSLQLHRTCKLRFLPVLRALCCVRSCLAFFPFEFVIAL